jgi:phasin family protein
MDQPNNETATSNAVEAVSAEVVEAVKKVNARRVKTERRPYVRKAVKNAAAAATAPVSEAAPAAAPTFNSKEIPMQFDPTNWMKNFTNFGANVPTNFANLPGTEGFQSLFTELGSRGQQALERSRTVAEEVSAMTRANMEALAETGRIAAAGAKSLSETVLERSRDGLEQAAAEVKTLTDAQSPTEFFQRQSELVRAQFDRAVADGSRFTESLVKLAGEAIQPLSSQAAVNAEKLNTIAA